MYTFHRKANVSYEIAQAAAVEIKLQSEFANTHISKLVFSKNWFSNFAKRRGFSYSRHRGTAKYIPITVIEDERQRIRDGFAGYSDKNVVNCDETAFFHNALSKYSWQQREQRGRDLLNEKERFTLLCYVAKDGSVPFTPLILAKHFPQGLPRGKIEWANGTTKGRYLKD